MTFGYARAEVLGAFVSFLTLILLGLWLVGEAAMRFPEPPGIEGWWILGLAGLAFAVDAATALLTFSMSRDSMNIRPAFLHNLADARGSVAAMVAGAAILIWDWRLADPVATLLIAGCILWHGLAETGPATRILMLGAPPGMALDTLRAQIVAIEGIEDVHHLHLWQLEERRVSLEAHLVIAPGRWDEAERLADRARSMLRRDHGIAHATLQTERPGACVEAAATV